MISFYESRLRFKTDPAQLPPLTKASIVEPKLQEEAGAEVEREEAAEDQGNGIAEEQPVVETIVESVTETANVGNDTLREETTVTEAISAEAQPIPQVSSLPTSSSDAPEVQQEDQHNSSVAQFLLRGLQ